MIKKIFLQTALGFLLLFSYSEGDLKGSVFESPRDKEKNVEEIENDIQLLTLALKEEPCHAQNMFNLARSHQLLNRYEEAIKWYKARIQLGNNAEEVWCSDYMIGECYEALGQWEYALPIYLENCEHNLNRAEPLYRLAQYYRSKGYAHLAHLFAKRGSGIPYPSDQNLYVYDPVYDYLIDHELSIASYYTPFKEDGLAATNRLMLKRNVPPHIKENACRNILFYMNKLPNAAYVPISDKFSEQQAINHEYEAGLSYDPIIFYKPGKPSVRFGNEPSYEFSQFKSNSPPLKWDHGFLMIVYEVATVDEKKHHIHRFVSLDQNFVFKSLSKPFIFQNLGVEQCGRSIIDHAEKKLIIPVAFENSPASLVIVELDTIQNLLEPLSLDQEHYQVIVPNEKEFHKLKNELHRIIDHEWAETNPFAIPFVPKETLADGDYKVIQEQLKTLKVNELIKSIYPSDRAVDFTTLEDFENRCTVGSRQVMIDAGKNLYPIRKLEKIGYGSDTCIISFCSYNKQYPELLKSIPEALKQTGYNGYFFYQIGGYPNPTGKETLFAGIPYVFKLFMMLEAYKLGFSKIIWLDASIVPLNNPAPLFGFSDAYFYGSRSDEYARYLLPATEQLLKELTGTDVCEENHVYAPIFGLNMDSDHVKNLIKTYYRFAAKGAPFLSCAPEEFVLTAILGQSDYKNCRAEFRHKLLHYPLWGQEKPEDMAKLKEDGFYFYHHTH